MAELGDRAEKIRSRKVDPKDDNHLKLASEGRRAAQDFRLLDPEAAVGVQKVDVASERIAAVYRDTKDREFRADNGEPHPRPGALQIVFADLGTPKDDGSWSLYEEFRARLADLGVPREKIRFVHEAKNDKQKAELFRACREGEVAVLLGSTEKMGVGTNIQARAVALHHIDVPYRPSDVTQREGRILRQGNQNTEVQILRYVTEGSFDGYVWQLVTGKNEHQQGFLNWENRDRTMSAAAMDDVQLSLQEIKALATGNPLLMEHAECLAEVKRLQALEQAHASSQRYRESRISSAAWRVEHAEQEIARANRALAALPATNVAEIAVGEGFRVVVDDEEHCEQAPANRALVYAVGVQRNRFIVQWKTDSHRKQAAEELTRDIGKLGPYTITVASPHGAHDAVLVRLAGVPMDEIELVSKEVIAHLNEGSLQLVQRLVNQVRKLPDRVRASELELKIATTELDRATHAGATSDFPQAAELLTKRLRLEELERELASGAARAAAEEHGKDLKSMPAHERDSFMEAATAEYDEKRAALFERLHADACEQKVAAKQRLDKALEALVGDADAEASREEVRIANVNFTAARDLASDTHGELTQRVALEMQREYGALAKLHDEVQQWRKERTIEKGPAASSLAQPQPPETRAAGLGAAPLVPAIVVAAHNETGQREATSGVEERTVALAAASSLDASTTIAARAVLPGRNATVDTNVGTSPLLASGPGDREGALGSSPPLAELVSRLQKEHGVRARALPSDTSIRGLMAYADVDAAGASRAVVVAKDALYVVTAPPHGVSMQVGVEVELMKRPEGVRITTCEMQRLPAVTLGPER
jgi:hypothetical protein